MRPCGEKLKKLKKLKWSEALQRQTACLPFRMCQGSLRDAKQPRAGVLAWGMRRLRTLLLAGPAPPDAAAVWFGDLPVDAPLECCCGPPSDPSAMGLWFPKLAADAKLEIIVGPAPAGPGMGIWRGTVLDWPGSVFMVGAPHNHKQERWKLPLPLFIEECYRKRFGKEHPDDPRPLEIKVAEKAQRKAAKQVTAQEVDCPF